MSNKENERPSTALTALDKTQESEDKSRICLSNVLDNVNNNNLNMFYPKDESLFKKRIDKLNLKFYIETEKYLSNKNDMEGCQDKLFMILFKQISLYIEEVERLNTLLRFKREDEKSTKEKLEDLNKKYKDKASTQLLVTSLRNSIALLEKKLAEKTKSEERIRKENESLKRQNKFYKEKLKIDLAIKRMQDENKLRSSNGSVDSANLRGGSKDKSVKKISININNHNNLNINNEILITENHYITEGKKRNFSDNNPANTTKTSYYPSAKPKVNTRYSASDSLDKSEKTVMANSSSNLMIKSPTNRMINKMTVSSAAAPGGRFSTKGGDMGIIKTVKQQARDKIKSKDESTVTNINANSTKLGDEGIKSPRVDKMETLCDAYMNNLTYLNSELDYLNELEKFLRHLQISNNEEDNTRQNLNNFNNFSNDMTETKFLNRIHKHTKNLPLLTSVTIDLSDRPRRTTIDLVKENKYKLK